MKDRDKEFSFVIKAHLGTINQYQTGWKKELNLVEWNGTPQKIDIRDWDTEHVHMGRGITLHRKEAERLLDLLYQYLNTEIKGEDQDLRIEQTKQMEQELQEATHLY